MTQASNPRNSNGARRRALRKRIAHGRPPCHICGYPIDYDAPHHTPTSYVVDEVVPVCRGGSPYSTANCRAAHYCCNAWRGSKELTSSLTRRIRTRYEREVLHVAKRPQGAAQGATEHATSREW